MEPVLEPAPSVNSNPSPIPPPINSVPPFLSKTYDMVDDLSTNEVVSWSSGNNSFVVWDVPEFSKVFLPKYFKHNNFSSFVRQLNTYVNNITRDECEEKQERKGEYFLSDGEKHRTPER
ncbi:hypothetical protein DY000_02018810 [Brassica cretica]|uniref:HSF-type DNA-binding domain-containing protein n=1 Tax=Brassica cretica TaxID=69181 RepID=A0ABQ7D7B4_BRACR|nr:hypothetical protein DY000_02018810 [Brassica cretica]